MAKSLTANQKNNNPKPAKRTLGVDTTNNFSLVTEFKGYRNKEDITNLPPGFMVLGSQNVLSTTGGRFGVRRGYELDGSSSTSGNPVLSAIDWPRHLGNTLNLRVAANSGTSGTSTMQMRYVASGGEVYGSTTLVADTVYWLDLKTDLHSPTVNWCDFWSTTERKSELLFVDGSASIYEWTGAVAQASTYGTSTITVSGVKTWGEYGFLLSGTRSFIMNGTTYTYTGGESTTTLTGVSPAPSNGTNALVIQAIRQINNSGAVSSLPTTYKNDLIANLRNQIYIGSLTNQQVYVSKTDSFTDFSFTSPVRVVGEGALLTLDGTPSAFIPQEDTMYISAGQDYWYTVAFQLSSDNSKENLFIKPSNTVSLQSAKSQALTSKTKNNIFFVSNEPIFNQLGRVTDNFFYPQTSNISDAILNDFNAYNFTNASCFYFKYFMYITLPSEGKVLIYNMSKQYWEPPQTIPVSRLYVVDGELYGHSSQTTESYRMFTGYNDNGQPINASAVMSYENYGTRVNSKFFDEFYSEGYISGNTTLNIGIKYEIDSIATITSYEINGLDADIVAVPTSSASLGKISLGKTPLGSDTTPLYSTGLPPKFRGILTFPRQDFYEAQYSFSSNQTDANWEVLAYGPLVTMSPYGQNAIKK